MDQKDQDFLAEIRALLDEEGENPQAPTEPVPEGPEPSEAPETPDPAPRPESKAQPEPKASARPRRPARKQPERKK